ncbi:permease [candidate division KSB1 bacterium]|nr:permease [candidate division KSB1 bacterium]
MIFEIITGILTSTYQLLLDMAPYLLFGFVFAGILNEFFSTEKLAKHLGKSSIRSVLKAAIFGIPLPLCSCGVIPPTMTLRKNGASRGAVISFLIATPTSGIDSIMATWSLLGPFFAVYRVFASFVAAVFSGISTNLLDEKSSEIRTTKNEEKNTFYQTGFLRRIGRIFHYAFFELLGEIGKWLILGLFVGGVITFFIPDNFFSEGLLTGWQAILVMLVIGLPLYVCATGSIPIAAALFMKGLNPGAAFVFLLAGPATNAVTLTVIGKYLGRKTVLIYLVTLIISSIGLGLLLDVLWKVTGYQLHLHTHGMHEMLPVWLKTSAGILLMALLVFYYIKNSRLFSSEEKLLEMKTVYKVSDMTCNNCVAHVTNALKSIKGIEFVSADLSKKNIFIQHEDHVTSKQMENAIRDAGYTPEAVGK